jgi:putative signal transducing protein
MNDEELVTLTTYRDVPEATIVQAVLVSHGVTAYLENAEMAIAAGFPGMCDVKLQVATRDVDEANDILWAIKFEDASVSSAPWTCPKCGASVEEGFDACWSCGELK